MLPQCEGAPIYEPIARCLAGGIASFPLSSKLAT